MLRVRMNMDLMVVLMKMLMMLMD